MTTLLLIDVQNDFHPGGSLAIPTASDDAERIAAFLRTYSSSISRIVMTLDSHHRLHIAHPCFWTDIKGKHPDPFTLISSEDIRDGKWIPRKDLKHRGSKLSSSSSKSKSKSKLIDDEIFAMDRGGGGGGGGGGRRSPSLPLPPPNLYHPTTGEFDIVSYCIEYTKRLESSESNKFQLCIWPEHCLIGSLGHNVVPIVMEAVMEWSDVTGGSVEWIDKGQNLLTEMYSALSAEVPVDARGMYNVELLESLREGTQKLVMCGQALSHCVNYTVRDIVDRWPRDEMDRLTVLEDCASSVPGFESAGEEFLRDMRDAGVNVETSVTFRP